MNERMPAKPLTAWGVASAAARLYTEALQTVLPLAIPAALAAVLTELLQPEGENSGAGFGMATASLVVSVIYAWLVIAVQHRVYSFSRGDGSTGESLRTAAARLLPLVGATLIAGLALGLPFALAAGVAVWAWGNGVHAAAILVGLAAALGLCYAAIRLATLTAEVVLRPGGPVESLRRSWALTRGHVWHIALVYLALLVLIVAVFVAALIVAAILGIVAPSLAEFLASIVSVVLLSVFVLPFGAAVVVMLWYDLRLRAGELPTPADA